MSDFYKFFISVCAEISPPQKAILVGMALLVLCFIAWMLFGLMGDHSYIWVQGLTPLPFWKKKR